MSDKRGGQFSVPLLPSAGEFVTQDTAWRFCGNAGLLRHAGGMLHSCWQSNLVQRGGRQIILQKSVVNVTSQTLQEGLRFKAASRMRYISNFYSTEIFQNIYNFFHSELSEVWPPEVIAETHSAMKTWGVEV
jgi:hypothetical protein